jgi:2-polyprenyl-3-methyl-5-hydroxy-6-metoxy-1,4-benzoquinol methylase
MGEETSWSRLFEYRGQIHKKYPDIWDLKILRKRFPLMVRNIRDGEKVLDIGASNRNLQERLRRHFPELIYKSMDIDREQFHDFYSLGEIQECFDVIFLFEVIEHLDLEEGIRLLKRSYDLLTPGGRLILTTPNIFNPNRFWRDATHRVAYCYDELGGILLAQGFQIKEMYRTYSDAFHRYLFRVYVMAPLHRYLGIDFAKSILAVAEKQRNESG